MTDLVVRKMPFEFDGAPFLFNPANPAFSVMLNAITFQSIGFEKYICKTMNAAEKLVNDPAMSAEIRAFNAQEMVHSQAHRKHAKALIEAYPGLQEALDLSIAEYDRLFEERDLKFHLAYCANIEATFAPLFGTIIDHRDLLFAGGDPRVSSLFLWHFVEEMEHKASAHMIYDHIVRNPFYRFFRLRMVFGHIKVMSEQLYAIMHEHVPESRGIETNTGLAVLPKSAMRRIGIGLFASQMPWHRPGNARIPDYYAEWRTRYEAGEDMRFAYSA
jgi:predicted metal-dependent hydrolase